MQTQTHRLDSPLSRLVADAVRVEDLRGLTDRPDWRAVLSARRDAARRREDRLLRLAVKWGAGFQVAGRVVFRGGVR